MLPASSPTSASARLLRALQLAAVVAVLAGAWTGQPVCFAAAAAACALTLLLPVGGGGDALLLPVTAPLMASKFMGPRVHEVNVAQPHGVAGGIRAKTSVQSSAGFMAQAAFMETARLTGQKRRQAVKRYWIPEEYQRHVDALEGLTIYQTENGDFPPLKHDLLIRAMKGQRTERPPVWVMRQAGRYLPEFREMRAGEQFFETCRDPAKCCELTMQPIRRYPQLDGSIIFSDILVIPQAMGMDVVMKPEKGPVLLDPIRSPEDFERLNFDALLVKDKLKYVYEAVDMTRRELDGRVPLFGFTGAPWTLFDYMCEGSGSVNSSHSKRFLYNHPEEAHKILQAITDFVVAHLVGQVQAGAQCLQVFESNGGQLSPEMYEEFAMPYCLQIGRALKKLYPDIPIGLFPRGAPHTLEVGKAGYGATKVYDVIGLDPNMDPTKIRRKVGRFTRVQGNFDPCLLYASKETIDKTVAEHMKKHGTRRWVANMGHGMYPDHDPEHLGWFLDAIHREGKKQTKWYKW